MPIIRHLLAALSIAVLTVCVPAAEPAKPNTLTPKEVADGWLLLFDGETTFGWIVDGDAKVENGTLVFGGTRPTKAETLMPLFSRAQIYADLRWEGKEAPDFDFCCLHAKAPSGETFHPLSARCEIGASDSKRNPDLIAIQLAAIRVVVPAHSKLVLKNVKLQPLGLHPLFNGKDLTGWKRFDAIPRRTKSKFTVTPEGWLNVKDGSGDLQTEGQWADFVLQLECISNGKHLNSGIFFRAHPGKYQQGYEAQIRNEFTAKPTQEYTIEEYDPITHALKAKRKEKFTAVDYGTGAIYRRVPARKQVAKDGEWFTMTVVARGPHLATWVNGVQVTDWTDNRPRKDNAREGCCLNKGAISIQGHDPTTDLSFRNIRLAELPAGK